MRLLPTVGSFSVHSVRRESIQGLYPSNSHPTRYRKSCQAQRTRPAPEFKEVCQLDLGQQKPRSRLSGYTLFGAPQAPTKLSLNPNPTCSSKQQLELWILSERGRKEWRLGQLFFWGGGGGVVLDETSTEILLTSPLLI